VGGGIAGLSVAYYLQRKSAAQGISIGYSLFEAGQRLGGKVRTHRENGFVIEGGPDSFITQKPWGLQLCRDLDLEDRLIPCNEAAQKVYVVRKGRLVPMPAGFRLAAPTKWGPFVRTPLLSPAGKLRVGLDLVIPSRTGAGDESIADFVRRRFGQEALESMAGPIMAGIHVADPEALSLRATFPMFAEIEQKHGSVIRGLARARKSRAGHPPPPPLFMSFREGMQTLTDNLASHLTGDIRVGEKVTGLRAVPGGYEVLTATGAPLATGAVVLAGPADATAELLAPHDERLAGALRALRSVSSATLSLGFRRADFRGETPLDGFGFMVPHREHRNILACTWSSTKFSSRAPDGMVVVRVFVGGAQQEQVAEKSDEEIRSLVLDELCALMKIRCEPVIEKLFRWPKGNPQYDVGHLDRVAALEERARRLPGIYLAGSSYRGIGIPDCIESALGVVDRLLGDAVDSAPSVPAPETPEERAEAGMPANRRTS
jgi:oxygen-dependent protoporphyrinogen oxidase